MKRHPFSPSSVLLPSIALSLLLSLTDAIAPVTPPAIAQTDETSETVDLEDLNRTTTLFNAMLIVLALLLGTAIAGLWMLRRSVVREVTVIVKDHLNELTDLEDRISAAHKELRSLLKETDVLAEELDEGVVTFRRDVKARRDELSALLSDFSQLKENALDSIDEQLGVFEKRLKMSEGELSTQLTEIQRAITDEQDESRRSLDRAEGLRVLPPRRQSAMVAERRGRDRRDGGRAIRRTGGVGGDVDPRRD